MRTTVFRLLIGCYLILVARAFTYFIKTKMTEPKNLFGDVINTSSLHFYDGYFRVKYPSGVMPVDEDDMTPYVVKDTPTIKWEPVLNDTFYTVAMIDLDVPSRENPGDKEFKHWLVINIPGDDMSKGETLAEYIGAGPAEGTGIHRYAILLYKQKDKITTNEKKVDKNSLEGRYNFSISEFANKYGLGNPIKCVTFQAYFDGYYVPVLHKRLGLA